MKSISGVDPLFLALSRHRRRRFEASVEGCDEIMRINGRDMAALYLKTLSLTRKTGMDEDLEEVGLGELLMEDNATAAAPRPGTSLSKPMTPSRGYPDQSLRPVSASGRPLTGFVRPGTNQSMPVGRTGGGLDHILRGSTAARPGTMLGREIRLATSSLAADGGAGNFFDINRLNFQTLAQRPALAIAIAEYDA
jgi:tetratricopeptide repeat protein 8